MRIIAGKNRGMILSAPKGLRVRPTADLVKESLFNILSTKVVEARVLDLFSGTGNLGLEALSRGASQAVLVDKHAESIAIITENVHKLKCGKQARLMKLDCMVALERLVAVKEKFDIIFCDPPYNCGWLSRIASYVARNKILATAGWLVIEHSVDEVPGAFSGLKIVKSRRYGATILSFFSEDDNADSSLSG